MGKGVCRFMTIPVSFAVVSLGLAALASTAYAGPAARPATLPRVCNQPPPACQDPNPGLAPPTTTKSPTPKPPVLTPCFPGPCKPPPTAGPDPSQSASPSPSTSGRPTTQPQRGDRNQPARQVEGSPGASATDDQAGATTPTSGNGPGLPWLWLAIALLGLLAAVGAGSALIARSRAIR